MKLPLKTLLNEKLPNPQKERKHLENEGQRKRKANNQLKGRDRVR